MSINTQHLIDQINLNLVQIENFIEEKLALITKQDFEAVANKRTEELAIVENIKILLNTLINQDEHPPLFINSQYLPKPNTINVTSERMFVYYMKKFSLPQLLFIGQFEDNDNAIENIILDVIKNCIEKKTSVTSNYFYRYLHPKGHQITCR